jgi:tetratricopeptide (TPR) repeat protein
VHVLYQEALARFGLEQLDQSGALLTELIQAAPYHRPALVLLGSAHQLKEDHAKALHYLERAAAIEAPNAALKEMIEFSRGKLISSNSVTSIP